MKKSNKRLSLILTICISILLVSACAGDDTYSLAKKIYKYDIDQVGYEEALEMAKAGNYDPNCRDCFTGADSSNISLFAYACKVDYEIAKAIYENGADIEISNSRYPQSPLLAALDGNRDNPEIIYWLINEGADINAIDYDNNCVFHMLHYWEDNEETQALIRYFEENCDMEYLRENATGPSYCTWDSLWDDAGNLILWGRG